MPYQKVVKAVILTPSFRVKQKDARARIKRFGLVQALVYGRCEGEAVSTSMIDNDGHLTKGHFVKLLAPGFDQQNGAHPVADGG